MIFIFIIGKFFDYKGVILIEYLIKILILLDVLESMFERVFIVLKDEKINI